MQKIMSWLCVVERMLDADEDDGKSALVMAMNWVNGDGNNWQVKQLKSWWFWCDVSCKDEDGKDDNEWWNGDGTDGKIWKNQTSKN